MHFPPVFGDWVTRQAEESGETIEQWLRWTVREALPEAAQRDCRREASEQALADYEAEFGPIPRANQEAAEALWPA